MGGHTGYFRKYSMGWLTRVEEIIETGDSINFASGKYSTTSLLFTLFLSLNILTVF